MRYPTLFAGVFAILLTLQGRSQQTQGSDTLMPCLGRLLDTWHRSAARADHAAFIGAMAPGGCYVGTDASEYWTTEEFSKWCKPYFDRGKAWDFHPYERHISIGPDGTTAWFYEGLWTQMGCCRGSGTLARMNGRWKITQYVLSAAIPNALMKQAVAMKSGYDTATLIDNIYKAHGMHGSLIILDPATGCTTGYRPDRWDSGYLPASTFKVPNTLIGLELGEVDTGYIFKWNGEKRRLPDWNRDLTLAQAFRVSCVPCFQELARRTGPEKMRAMLDRIGYPGMVFTAETIDNFWLEGASRITPRQQALFISRIYREELPLRPATLTAMKQIMLLEQGPGYALYGKTGWAVRNGNDYGWFVGWVEKNGKALVFATQTEPDDPEHANDFAAARKLITAEVLKAFGLGPGTP